jgi:hypothetical protein
MVREIHVHQGRVVPPDFREDVGERQPGGKQMSNTPEDATMDETDQNQGDAVEKDGLQIPPPATAEPADPTSWVESPATYSTIHPAATMAVIGIAALDQRQRWSEQVDHAYQAGQRRLTRAARLCRRLRRDKTESQL